MISDKPLKKQAALFRHDSVYGNFPGIVEVDAENSILYVNRYKQCSYN